VEGDVQEVLHLRGFEGAGPPAATPAPSIPADLDERPARSELRRQIGRLEGDLGAMFASAFPRGAVEWSAPASGGPRILSLGELEAVRDLLADRVEDVRSILDGRATVEARNRELIERMVAAPERYKWVRVSNDDIGEPGCRHWHSRPKLGLIGMLMGWWRVKVSSGCPLAGGRRGSGVPHQPRTIPRISGNR
jgi:hypothetical protein